MWPIDAVPIAAIVEERTLSLAPAADENPDGVWARVRAGWAQASLRAVALVPRGVTRSLRAYELLNVPHEHLAFATAHRDQQALIGRERDRTINL